MSAGNGQREKLRIRNRVSGYTHSELCGRHFFQRGNTAYIFDVRTETVTVRKFDYVTCSYLDIGEKEGNKFMEIRAYQKYRMPVGKTGGKNGYQENGI